MNTISAARTAVPRQEATGTRENPLDLLCVGIGPFGLGLACLADPLTELKVAFLDRAQEFSWHPGLLFDDATLQVPFLADLVTMADPTSRFSFLAWLKHTERLYPFYVRESFYPLRREYNDYCRWAAANVRGLHWGQDVVAVERPLAGGPWKVTSRTDNGDERLWWTRHLVVGTGTVAAMPQALHGAGHGLSVGSADPATRKNRTTGLSAVRRAVTARWQQSLRVQSLGAQATRVRCKSA